MSECFLGSEILTQRDFFSVKDAGIFLGREKNRDFWVTKKALGDFFFEYPIIKICEWGPWSLMVTIIMLVGIMPVKGRSLIYRNTDRQTARLRQRVKFILAL